MNTPDLSPEEEALYNMSDEELEAAFREAKSSEESDEVVEDEIIENEIINESDEEEEDTEEIFDEDDGSEVDELDEDLEQPDQDSDEEVDDDGIETDDEEDDTTDEDDTDESDETVDVQPTEDIKLENQKFKVKADGTEFEFNIEELKQLAPKAMNYTRKMQELKPWRKTISALQDNGVSHDDINLMIDVLKGDEDAMASIIKKTGFDTLELDPEKEVDYAPREHGRTEQELDIQEIENRISKDQEYNITTHVVNTQWDNKSREAMFDNPAMIEGLHADIKSGVFDKVSPMAMKLKVLDGGQKADIEYYVEAGSEYYRGIQTEQEVTNTANTRAQEEEAQAILREKEAVEEVKQRASKQKTIKKTAARRKAAAPTKKAAGHKSVTDYLGDDDEKFDDWYNKLQASI